MAIPLDYEWRHVGQLKYGGKLVCETKISINQNRKHLPKVVTIVSLTGMLWSSFGSPIMMPGSQILLLF